MARPLLCALLLSTAIASPAPPSLLLTTRRRSELALLRCRGGGDGISVVGRAAQKLCTQPGLVASTGTSGGFSLSPLAKHVRGVVFGGMDGILTTFALLAAVEGSQQTSDTLWRLSKHPTSVFFLMSERAAAACPVTNPKERRLREAFGRPV